MISTATRTLWGTGLLALVLMGVVANEAMTAMSAPERPPRADALIQMPQRPEATGASDQTGRLLREVLGRPVFNPDRRPAASSGVSRATGLSRLTGVVISDTQKIAIFATAPDGRKVSAQEGEHVGAYEITRITVAGVTVSGPEGVAIVTPAFDPTAQPAAKAALSVPVPKAGRSAK